MPAGPREGALQFGDGARRRRDRQLALHGRPHRPAAPLRARRRCASSIAAPICAPSPARAVEPDRVERLRKAWGVAPHERIVLLAARLTAWKGQRVLIEAARRLRRRGVDDIALHSGRRPAGPRRLCAASSTRDRGAGLGAIVRRVGHCADMPAAFLAASVVTVPSTEPEAFGRSAVEAQAMGAPVVVSDLGAVPETVLAPPQVPALRAPAGASRPATPARWPTPSREALALGASARDALARRARGHVEAHFSLERMFGETLAVYAAMLIREDRGRGNRIAS